MIAGRDDLFCSLIFTKMEEEANTECHDSNIAILPGLVAHVGMKFRNSDEAWAFWLSHGGQKGFEDRKRYSNSEMRTTRSHGWTLPVLRKGNSRASAKAPISCPSNVASCLFVAALLQDGRQWRGLFTSRFARVHGKKVGNPN
ncbi:uncharacterized protein [Setaria viridis]|uniref:uncharacterized protein isoform X1 n=2 Tax=Setaria viridis TaxID=4556 RepID=UPI003B3B9B48